MLFASALRALFRRRSSGANCEVGSAGEVQRSGRKRALDLKSLAPSILLFIASASPAAAQTPEEFYKERQVTLYIGSSAGGGYDRFGRLLARHIGQHIPGNPVIVPRNMPGASGIKVANYLYSVAPKDGSAIGTFNQAIPLRQVLDKSGVEFDASKFGWIGTMGSTVDVLFTWHGSGVQTLEDAKKKDLTMGALTEGGSMSGYPLMLNSLLRTKFKIVQGYEGGNSVDLAMERGEVQGRGSMTWTALKGGHPDWVRDKKVNILVQIGKQKHPELADVPLLDDLAETDEQRQIFRLFSSVAGLGYPFVAPPGVPSERLEVLRTAFLATMRDEKFQQEAQRLEMETTWETGPDIEKIVAAVVATPPAVAERAKSVTENPK
jgi:tripartite-type tricarboxylate transporter receptor subunit TctC